MRWMCGWSYDDLLTCPGELVEVIIETMRENDGNHG